MNCSRLTKWMGYLLLPIILVFASQTELSAQNKKITLKSSKYEGGKTTFVWELKTSKNSKLNFSNFNDCVDEDDVEDVKDKEKDEDEDDRNYGEEKSEKSKKSNYRYNSGKSKKNKFSLSQYFSSKSKQEDDDDDDRPGPSDAFGDSKKLKIKTVTLVLVGKYKSKTISIKRKVSDRSSDDENEEIDIPVKVHEHPGKHDICEGEEIESDHDDDNNHSHDGNCRHNYSWSKLNDISFSQTSRNFKPSSAGSYTLSYDDEDGCENEEEHEVTIKKKTEITAQPIAPAAVCIGATPGTLSVTATGQGTLTYQWYKDGVKIEGATSSTYAPSGTVAGSFQYYVVVKGECGEKESNKVTVVVNPLPVVTLTETDASGSANNDGIICVGGKAVLTATGGGTYVWAPGGATTASIEVSPVATTEYSVSVTNEFGCPTSKAITVTVKSKPEQHEDHHEDHNHGGVCKEISIRPTGTNKQNWYWKEGASEKSGNTTPKPSTEKSGDHYEYEYSETNEDGCESDRSDVDVHIVSVPYYTFSQSYYGSKKGKVCIITEVKEGKATRTATYNKPLDLINASLASLTGFSLKLGEKGGKDGYKGMFVISKNESTNLNAMLPMSGKSDAIRDSYECNSSDKKSKEKAFKLNNELLGQVIALALSTSIPEVGDDLGNFDLSKAGDKCIVTKKAPGCVDRKEERYDREDDDHDGDDRDDDSRRFISSKVLNAVGGAKSINDLVKFAVEVLFDKSKLPANVSYKDVAKTLKAVNEAFEHGRYFVKLDQCRKGDDHDDDDRKSAAMSMLSAGEEVGSASNAGSSNVVIGAYPNPYNDKISFRLTAKQTAKSSLVIYNMLGQKIANLFEGEMQANATTNIEYNVPAAQRKNLVFVFRNGTYSTTGKLIKSNQ